jgi:hypothetical protein
VTVSQVENSNSFECANKTIIFRRKYKHYFFYNRILKFLNFLIFVKFSLDAKIFVKNDILCDSITMHKCHVFLTVVENIFLCATVREISHPVALTTAVKVKVIFIFIYYYIYNISLCIFPV